MNKSVQDIFGMVDTVMKVSCLGINYGILASNSIIHAVTQKCQRKITNSYHRSYMISQKQLLGKSFARTDNCVIFSLTNMWCHWISKISIHVLSFVIGCILNL